MCRSVSKGARPRDVTHPHSSIVTQVHSNACLSQLRARCARQTAEQMFFFFPLVMPFRSFCLLSLLRRLPGSHSASQRGDDVTHDVTGRGGLRQKKKERTRGPEVIQHRIERGFLAFHVFDGQVTTKTTSTGQWDTSSVGVLPLGGTSIELSVYGVSR